MECGPSVDPLPPNRMPSLCEQLNKASILPPLIHGHPQSGGTCRGIPRPLPTPCRVRQLHGRAKVILKVTAHNRTCRGIPPAMTHTVSCSSTPSLNLPSVKHDTTWSCSLFPRVIDNLISSVAYLEGVCPESCDRTIVETWTSKAAPSPYSSCGIRINNGSRSGRQAS